MPDNTMGIGTKFFGASDRREDASFVTTEWIIFFHIPIIPLRSLRVSIAGHQEEYGHEIIRYNVFNHVPLSWKQIISAYAWLVIPILLTTMIAKGLLQDGKIDQAATFCTVVLTMGIGFWILIFPLIYKAE